jgi:hypothetical protein
MLVLPNAQSKISNYIDKNTAVSFSRQNSGRDFLLAGTKGKAK